MEVGVLISTIYTFAPMQKAKQLHFNKPGFKKEKSKQGGNLKNPQKRKRPLGLRSSTHLVLRSTQAKKHWSFKSFEVKIHGIINKFSKKYHIQVINRANVGNHLHLHDSLKKTTQICSL